MGTPFQLGYSTSYTKMGRVRTKTVKKAAKLIIEKYYTRLTLDFHVNKRICEEIAIIPSKPLRNKIAGFVTHLMKRFNTRLCEEFPSNCKRKNAREEITTFQRLQSWISTPLKLTAKPRTCRRCWN